MNCLACQGVVRTNSIKEFGELIDVPLAAGLWTNEETDEIPTKSAPLKQPPKPDYGKMRSTSNVGAPFNHKKVKINVPRRCNSTIAGSIEDQPKLVRSSGMRRDWSFEDLRKTVTA
ncbi:uncharacterized protein LOC141695706 [Apium graveolens]|uniref:uncharacterized protein LOC141695706 n=1 Tax=Apium graveolens TaxID=4045 RepID=UPI003D7914C3